MTGTASPIGAEPPPGSEPINLDFGTDEVGNIVGLTVGAAANDRVYDYDDLNRLTSVVNGSAANVEAFTYDPTGRAGLSRGTCPATPTFAH